MIKSKRKGFFKDGVWVVTLKLPKDLEEDLRNAAAENFMYAGAYLREIVIEHVKNNLRKK